VSLDITTKKRETLREFGELKILSWSPDGNYLLVRIFPEICVFNIDQKIITACITSGVWGSWSPDGNNIAVIERLEDIWVVKIYSIQTQEETVISKIKRSDVYNIEKVQWSPDGKNILYILNRPIDDDLHEIHLIDLTTKFDKIFRKYDRLIYSPDWSPDGMFISYILTVGIIDELYISPINNQDCDIKLNIENMDIISDIQWSPDGRCFLFNWGQDIYTLDLEGLYGMPYTSLSGICPETSK
jgi:Tol biopolymer transport system component